MAEEEKVSSQQKAATKSTAAEDTAVETPADAHTADQQVREQEQQGDEDHKPEEEPEQELLIEQPLFTIKEVFVYRVPPLRASSGHRAEEWGLADPVFTGVLKMVQLGNSCCLRLFKPPPEGELGATPELFAECEVRLDKGRTVQVFVEPVIDSSRYFVLRCQDKASGRHAYVGIGFRERSSAFDLKAVLDDFVRFLDRQKRAAENSAVAAERDESRANEDAGEAPVRQMKDLSIAEGQKLHIDLKVSSGDGSTRTRRRPRSGGEHTSSIKTGGLALLAPPPQPGTIYKSSPSTVSPPVTPITLPQTETAPTVTTPDKAAPDDDEGSSTLDDGEQAEVAADSGGLDNDEDDGWGDFESA